MVEILRKHFKLENDTKQSYCIPCFLWKFDRMRKCISPIGFGCLFNICQNLVNFWFYVVYIVKKNYTMYEILNGSHAFTPIHSLECGSPYGELCYLSICLSIIYQSYFGSEL